ncbi:YeeE/YedE family protein [Acidovorax sp. CCYZU-2555]|uniref:YeeE/YedE family protein n=1 Tax=Acidovorax sp. CCYZU-2555 TaxID=2835042 RepID=UPI001BCF2DC0|nr:YeeE/YedE family protein [Acidovorax sp. CCYZU-2555]MBS7781374.1 YeeE/YedE family protein [Acidovorax sp. CCYZU-2555]
MSAAEFSSLSTAVLAVIFLLAAVLGFAMRATRFCTMGAISDVVYLQDWTRVRQWALAVGVAMCGATALLLWGGVAVGDTLYASNRLMWLSALVGGLMFGAGMVLASGCSAKNLTRLGGGSLKALVVLLVMGLAAFATLKGITAVARVRWLDSAQLQFDTLALLPELLAQAGGWPVFATRLALGLGLGGLLIALALRPGRNTGVLLGGLTVGLSVTAAWWLGGHVGEVAEHPETLEHMYIATYSGRIEAFSFVTPVAHTLDWLLFFSDSNKLLTWGIASVCGMVSGSLVHALWRRDFQWQGFADTQDLARHLLGALLMGVGGVTALGCTVGQGISALSLLSLGSLIAIAAIVAGAVAMLRYLASGE